MINKLRQMPILSKMISIFTNKYNYVNYLAQGSNGVMNLYKKRNKLYAIKTVKKDYINNEIEILMKLKNEDSSIIKLQDVYEDETFYNYNLVFDYLKGGELFDYIKELEFIPEKETSNLILKVLEMLTICHEKNILHLDIKPENLMFRDKEDKKDLVLIDFSCSQVFSSDSKNDLVPILSNNGCAGTLNYSAPEILENYAGFCSDMWSVGVLTYVMLTGYTCFKSKDAVKDGIYPKHPKRYEKLSDKAKDFIDKLININYELRMTLEEAKKHPFIINI